ncbi:hypothetical protein RhiLY_11953 [Ceratobasidium sp. AG-Ba]|nr:hypothetical protein RhiLY_11953 [Ceratobasidium sp. AG-Ba]
MAPGEMPSEQKPLLSSPFTSSKVFDLASPHLDPLERLRQLDCFGQKEIRCIQGHQELLLAAASALIPVDHPFLVLIKSAPFRDCGMNIQLFEESNQLNDNDVEMMHLYTMLVNPQGHNQLGHPTTIDPLQPSDPQDSSGSLPTLQEMVASLRDWSGSNPSDNSSHSGGSQVFSNIPSEVSDPRTVSSIGGVSFDLGAVPPALQILIDQTLVGDLRKNLSEAEFLAHISDARKSPIWTNFERNLIVQGLHGESRILPDKSTIHIDTPFSVRNKAETPVDWDNVAKRLFGERRSAFSTAQQYARMFKTYCHLAIMFTDHEQQLPVPVFLQRVYGGMSASTDGSIVGIPAKPEDLLSFIEGGDASWLATFYRSLHGDPRMKARYTSLCNKTIKAKAGSVMSSSSRSTRPLPQRSNVLLSAVRQSPNNPTNSLELSSTTETDHGGPTVDQNMNAVADLLRNNQVITEANIQEAKSRAAYLLRVADQMRWDLIAAINAQRKQEIKDKYDKCIAVLENPNLDADIKADAKKFVRAYINGTLGQPDITAIIRELQADLPSLDKLTNILYYAPALDPKNDATILAAAAAIGPAASEKTPQNYCSL